MIQSGGFLDKPLGPLLRTVFPLTKHIMQSFAWLKSFIDINTK